MNNFLSKLFNLTRGKVNHFARLFFVSFFTYANDFLLLFSVPLSQIPLGSRLSLMKLSQSAVVDLQESPAFSEHYYLVVFEKRMIEN